MSETVAPARYPASMTASMNSRCAGSPLTTSVSPFLTPSDALTTASAYRRSSSGVRICPSSTGETLLIETFGGAPSRRSERQVVDRRVDLGAAQPFRPVHLGQRSRDERERCRDGAGHDAV